jgi:aprataxin
MPRNLTTSAKHPLDALKDAETCAKLKEIVQKYTEKAMDEISESYIGDDNLESLVQAGVHAFPSLDNVHVHIISKDMHSPRLKNAKHYLTFNSPFFVPFDEIPSIGASDDRCDPLKMGAVLKGDLKCCWCGQNFKRSFAQLKQHLEAEYKRRFN